MIPALLNEAIQERDLQQNLMDLASLKGWLSYHTWRSVNSAPGFPDTVLVRERIVWIEVKRENGRLSKWQKIWLEALRRAGEEVYVLRPSNWPEIVEVLS